MTDQENCNGNLEHKVEHILISKVQLIYSVALVLIPIICFFWRIQLDIALIQQNHEAHMQTALEKIAELEKTESKLNDRLEKQNEAIIRLLQMHDK